MPEKILGQLSRLVDKSLVLVEIEKHGEPRYRMLDTIRQYALECLQKTGEDLRLRERHLTYYLQLAERAVPHLRAWGMAEWLDRLETELGNLRLALGLVTAWFN